MTEDFKDLDPSQIVRKCDGEKYFGYKHTQLDDKIKTGEIPAPKPLSSGGRAVGWFGWQVNEHHRRIRQNAAEWEAGRKAAREAAAAKRGVAKGEKRRQRKATRVP